jgi:hypothetical protein
VLLEFEVDTPNPHDLMALENATRMVFSRVRDSNETAASRTSVSRFSSGETGRESRRQG